MDLKEKVKQLPRSPGVYIMMDSQGNIIYIGKAKSLRNRVGQYFQALSKHPPKIQRMVEGIRSFDYINADTELEALLLECRLIKDIKPMYNSQLKNHKKYVYINIDIEEKFPILKHAGEKDENALSFGPYTSQGNVERAINAMKENLKIRHCSSFAIRKSGCLNYQLGLCTAPCTGEQEASVYRQQLDAAIAFLKGGKSDLLKDIEEKMHAAAEALNFDKAAKYRDDISALKHLLNKQKTIKYAGDSKLALALEKVSENQYKLFVFKGSRVIYKERLGLLQNEAAFQKNILGIILFNKQELLKVENSEIDKAEIDQSQIVYSYLKNKKDCCYMLIPKSWLSEVDLRKVKEGIYKLVQKLQQRD